MSFFFAKSATEMIAYRDAATDEAATMLGLLVGHHALARDQLEAQGSSNPSLAASSSTLRETALHRAAVAGDRALCEEILGAGSVATGSVFVDAQDFNKRTPLGLACLKGKRSVASLLLSFGADAAIRDKYERTPLHLACVANSTPLIWLLIENGVDLNPRDEDGFSPLMLAINNHGNGALEAVKLLVENGADVNLLNNKGQSPLTLAAGRGCLSVVRYLTSRDADLIHFCFEECSALHEAALAGHLAVVQHLVQDKRVPVDLTNSMGWTPLMEAVLEGHTATARYLLQQRADAAACRELRGGDTVLHLCARHVINLSHVDLLLDLLEAGADPLTTNYAGISVVKMLSRVRFSRNGLYELLINNITARVNAAAVSAGLLLSTPFLLRSRNSGREEPGTESMLDVLLAMPFDVWEENVLGRVIRPFTRLCEAMREEDSLFPALKLAPGAVAARRAALEKARQAHSESWLQKGAPHA